MPGSEPHEKNNASQEAHDGLQHRERSERVGDLLKRIVQLLLNSVDNGARVGQNLSNGRHP